MLCPRPLGRRLSFWLPSFHLPNYWCCLSIPQALLPTRHFSSNSLSIFATIFSLLFQCSYFAIFLWMTCAAIPSVSDTITLYLCSWPTNFSSSPSSWPLELAFKSTLRGRWFSWCLMPSRSNFKIHKAQCSRFWTLLAASSSNRDLHLGTYFHTRVSSAVTVRAIGTRASDCYWSKVLELLFDLDIIFIEFPTRCFWPSSDASCLNLFWTKMSPLLVNNVSSSSFFRFGDYGCFVNLSTVADCPSSYDISALLSDSVICVLS